MMEGVGLISVSFVDGPSFLFSELAWDKMNMCQLESLDVEIFMLL